MIRTASLQDCMTLDHDFLLLTHIICADQQIHSQESQALRDLAQHLNVSESTLLEMEKILGQDDALVTLEECAHKIPVEERNEVLRQILAIAYIDGYFSPLERKVVDQISELWGFHNSEIEQMLEYAQGFNRYHTNTDPNDEEIDDLSVGARLLKGAESVLSKSLVTRLVEIAPDHIGQKVEKLQHEILLSGPEYDDAIQQCTKIAREDFKYSQQALQNSSIALQQLGSGLQQTISTVKQKANVRGKHQSAKHVAEHLAKTQRKLSVEILHELESVRETFRSKKRALNQFSIAFMGRTKVGKSTLHAVMTGEGWESIGIGKQRTTRYNRIYEWRNIRIIDTPGIGAPGGKTDEEIARSIIEEADVICYVVTDDSIQESEFEFLKVLKDRTKPLIILLNIQYNLRDPRRLEHFLKNPERWFALEGKSGIGGHLNRIRRYAQQHYANSYLDVVPVMLLAAQLSREPEYKKQATELFRASRIKDFLDSIRLSLIDYGVIRRSQTLLGSTVCSINSPHQWCIQETNKYRYLATQLQDKRKDLNKQLSGTEEEKQHQLENQIGEIFQSAYKAVRPFAEEHWNSSVDQTKNDWKGVLKRLEFENRLAAVSEKASHDFQYELQGAIEEIGNELRIINQLQAGNFQFLEQDSNFFSSDFVQIAGKVMTVAGSVLAIVFAPLGLLGVAGWLVGLFNSGEKRRKAVKHISTSLNQQLKEQEAKVLKQSRKNFQDYCQSVAAVVDEYFVELIEGIEMISSQLKTAQEKLEASANYLNRAYAKRIVDWATDQSEPLTDTAINQKIYRINRVFGKSFQIETNTALSLSKSEKEICKVLQENISLQSKES